MSCRHSGGGDKWQHLLPCVAAAVAVTNGNICCHLSPQRRRRQIATFVVFCRRSGGGVTWQHLLPFVAAAAASTHGNIWYHLSHIGYPWIYMAIRGSIGYLWLSVDLHLAAQWGTIRARARQSKSRR